MKKSTLRVLFVLGILLTQGAAILQANNPTPDTLTTTPSNPNEAAINIQILSLGDISCFGLTDGLVTVLATGGLPPYAYVWSNGMIGPLLLGLDAGVYTCTVTDLLGAAAQATVTIEEPLELDLDVIAQVNIDCGHPEGSVTVDAEGGTGLALYLWSNGATTPTISNLDPGIYVVTATDENLCTTIQTVEVTADLTLPVVEVNASAEITCLEPEILLNATGTATGLDLLYLWTTVDGHILSGGNTLDSCVVDEEGTYTLTVLDLFNGCSASESVDVEANIQLPAVNIVSTGGVDLQLDCLTPEVILDGTGSATGLDILYLWTTADGHIVSGGNTLHPVVNAAGSYSLAVTNAANGCSDSEEVDVTASLDLPLVNILAGLGVDLQLDCFSPEITLSGEGSVTGPNFGHVWTTVDGHIVAGANTLHPVVDAAGTYTLTITNLLSQCSASSSVDVTLDINFPTANVESGTNIDLQLDCLTPEINLSGLGSSLGGNILYLWTTLDGHIVLGENTLEDVIVDAEGTYVLSVTNSLNGCVSQDSVDVTIDIDLPIADADVSVDLDCLNPTVVLSGNQSSQGNDFGYLWTTLDGHILSGANTLNDCEVDEPGTYVLTVSDLLNGCTAAASVDVEVDLDLPTANIAVPDILGCGNSIVELDATGSSQGPGFIYLWTTVNGNIVSGGNSLLANVNAAGTYTLTITALNGCTSQLSVDVEGSPAINVSITGLTHVSCFGGINGSLTLNVQGSAPFIYVWSNGMTTASVSGLAAGNYTATVTDDNGCAAIITVQIEQPTDMTATATSTGVSQPGGSNGTASVTVTGGTPPYQYAWSNGMTSANITGLAAGTYTFTVTDANGCTETGTVTVPDFDGCLLTLTATATNADCGMNNGTATIVAVGGSGTLTYLWSNGMTTASVSGLDGGTYTVTATDGEGCEAVASVTVNEADVLPPTVVVQNITVNLDANGLVSINSSMINNGSSDACDDDLTIIIDVTDFDCDDIGANTVTVTVTDDAGNDASATAIVTVVDNTPPTTHCPDDINIVDCSGVVVYEMPTLTDNCSNVSVSTSMLVQGLASGSIFPSGTTLVTYAVVSTTGDISTCSFNVTLSGTLNIQVNSNGPSCPGVSDGWAEAVVTGGSGNYTYFWLQTGQTTQMVTGLSAGTYNVIVTDDQGCASMTTVVLQNANGVTVTTFTVTDECGDELGSIDITVTGGTGPYTFVWYDENGNIVATTEDLTNVPAGEYTVEITDVNGCTYTSGLITVDFLNGTVDIGNNGADVNVYPNPTGSGLTDLNIELAVEGEVHVELYNLTGQWMATVLPKQMVQSINRQVDLRTYPGNTYMVKIFVDDVPVSTQKVVYVK